MRRARAEKIQLVFPPPCRPDTRVAKFASWPQPLGILSIATYLKQHNPGIDVEILDGNNILTMDQVTAKLNADVVGISATAVSYQYAVQLARAAKERGATVVLGGAAATPLAREILTYHDCVDAVIRYDGEIAFSEYVAGIPLAAIDNLVYREDGHIRENPVQLPDLDALPAPDRDFVDLTPYFENSKDPAYPICEPFSRPMNIYSQKGCVWRSQEEGGCVFCSIPYYDLRMRDPQLIWDEISLLVAKYQTDFIWDPSDNLVGDKDWFRSFCEAKPKDLNIHYTNYVDAKGMDEDIAQLLVESGCCSVFVGLEAGDPAMLKNMNKRSTLEDNIRAMELLEKYRIGVIVGVVVGVPGETAESLARTVSFLEGLTKYENLDRIEWGSLIPFPGSKANRLLRQHPDLREKYKNFGDDNYTLDLMRMVADWYEYFCEIDFDYVEHLQEQMALTRLVPYDMTKYQRRSWSGTPSKVFLD